MHTFHLNDIQRAPFAPAQGFAVMDAHTTPPSIPRQSTGSGAPRTSAAGVQGFHRRITESDALLISIPEHKHRMPDVLKCAPDQASRPHGQSVLNGKPFLVGSSSPGGLTTPGIDNERRSHLNGLRPAARRWGA